VSTTLSDSPRYPRSLLIVLVLGLLLRGLFISVHDRPLFSDEKEYDQLATNIATRAIYSYDSVPTAYRPVGYPAFVGCLYAILGHHVALVKLFQALLDTLSALLIYLLLACHPERTRVFGAALWCFCPSAIFYSSLLLSETVFTFLLVVFAWMLLREQQNGTSSSVVLGAAAGVLTLIKPTAGLFLLFLLVLLPRIKMSPGRIFPVLITFLLVLTPWLVRNYLVFGHAALSSNGGINLMIGNNPTTTGAYKNSFDPSLLRDTKGEFEADRAALGEAANYIVSNPATSVWNALKKTGRLVESEGALLILTFHDEPEDTSSSYRSKYASLPLGLTLLTNLFYFILVLAGIFGFLSSERNQLWWISLAAFASWIIIHATFFGGGRFHFPLMPFLVVFASQVVMEPRRSFRSLSMAGKVFACSALILLCSLWIIESYLIYHG
jgi:hypothetical protein